MHTERSDAWQDPYGLGDLSNIEMLYRHDGAESLFKYVQVEIKGHKAVCYFQYLNQPEQKYEMNLDPEFLKDLAKKHAELDFFDHDFKKITDSSDENRRIYDAGLTTMAYQYRGKKRGINYEIIRTKIHDNQVVPINEDAQKLTELQKAYWKMLNLQIYKDKLKNYQKFGKGTLADVFSSLAADIRKEEIINVKELVPLIIGIISQKEFCDSIGHYAVSALAAQENIPGHWWDCQTWLDWWQLNKSAYEKE